MGHMQARYVRTFFLLFWVTSCTIGAQNAIAPKKLEVKLTDTQTELIVIDSAGKSQVIGQYPLFPGLDPKMPRVNENLLRFANGNALIRLPDSSVVKKIRSWNDLSHLFDIVFVKVSEKMVVTILKDEGRNIRLVQGPSKDDCFLIQIIGAECKLLRITDKGERTIEQHYLFKAYPDKVSITKNDEGYIIEHDNIDENEKFMLDEKTGKIASISYKKNN
jgi:hypothetical protein